MSKIRDNINNELENISFDISADTIRKKAKLQKAKCNTVITTIACVCIVSVALCCGVVSGRNNVTVKESVTEATTQTETTNIQNTFTISACAVEDDSLQNIENCIANAEKNEVTENATVQVMEHRIIIEDFVNNGRTYHTFRIGETVEEKVDESENSVHFVVYSTEPIIYVTGNNIKAVEFSADNVTLDNVKTLEEKYWLEQASESMSNENKKIYTSMYYTRVPLPEEFNDLCIKCNETDYEFKFSDIPVVNITIKVTFENGEVQEQLVQAYYDDEGYFTIKS